MASFGTGIWLLRQLVVVETRNIFHAAAEADVVARDKVAEDADPRVAHQRLHLREKCRPVRRKDADGRRSTHGVAGRQHFGPARFASHNSCIAAADTFADQNRQALQPPGQKCIELRQLISS